MSKNKTIPTEESVKAFIESVDHELRKRDAYEALRMHEEITGLKPQLWGPSLIGYGKYHYKYESGREGDFFKAGFSPRKTAMTFYIMSGFPKYEELLEKLGKHKLGKSCLYIKDLEKVDKTILKEIIQKSFDEMNRKYPDEE